MNPSDKCKLKVLIKMILIYESPHKLTASQITNIINKYDFGIKTYISTAKVAKLLSSELRKSNKHFMDDIIMCKKKGVNMYYIELK